MRNVKSIKCIIAAVLVVAIVACGALVATKTGVFEEETTTTEPVTVPTARVTFIEGITVNECFKLLEENSVASYDELMQAAQNYQFTGNKVFSDIPVENNRAFKLEGYLFPDTYDFYLDESPESVIERFLSNADSKITDEMRARASELGYTMDEILTIASIIQAESYFEKDAPLIASVIYNRLESGTPLGMDSAWFYIERNIGDYLGEESIEKYEEYYHTYDFHGLPEGPICNPGMVAINAALYPEETDYFYFCNDEDGNIYYAVTDSEHIENCEKIGIY
ncbi:MAG: endolytic transglycosylase MltG [Clostridia bacterium]|nr:endolytic transglycosylase MltG [Clostridia bacterium]